MTLRLTSDLERQYSPRTSRRRYFLIGLSIVAALAFSGCGDDKPVQAFNPITFCSDDPEGTPTPEQTPIVIPGRSCPPESIVTCENFGSSFLSEYCTSCHSSDLPEGTRADAPVGVDFNQYQMVRDWSQRIYARAGDSNDTMPPAANVEPEQRDRLGEWLACDAPREQDMP